MQCAAVCLLKVEEGSSSVSEGVPDTPAPPVLAMHLSPECAVAAAAAAHPWQRQVERLLQVVLAEVKCVWLS